MLKTVSNTGGGTTGGVVYQGTWNASTNTPTLTSGSGTKGYYYVVGYVVHTSNGCGPYIGTPNYQGCLDTQKNYNSVVLKPIQQSAETIKFNQ